jgi:hypothetical protein
MLVLQFNSRAPFCVHAAFTFTYVNAVCKRGMSAQVTVSPCRIVFFVHKPLHFIGVVINGITFVCCVWTKGVFFEHITANLFQPVDGQFTIAGSSVFVLIMVFYVHHRLVRVG